MEHMISVADRHDPVDFEAAPDENPPEQELCFTLDEITVLSDLLTDRGIAPSAAPEWLRRWAQSKGYGSLEDTPGRLFMEAKEALTKILDERSQKPRDSASSPDNQ